MKLYGGIDLHSNNSVVALLDEEERLVYRKRLGNDAPGILEALAPYREAIVGLVVESTYNWYWLVDALMEAGYAVHLANTTALVQYSGLKYSDDDSDARWLAELLHRGLLAEGYIYPKEDRASLSKFAVSGRLSRSRLMAAKRREENAGTGCESLIKISKISTYHQARAIPCFSTRRSSAVVMSGN